MKILNKTKQTLLSSEAIVASKITDRGLGLLRYSKPQTLLIHTRFGIHTLGMRYPIDVLILNNENRVVKMKKNLQPNQIYLWNPKYSTILELPQGSIVKSKTTLHDYLSFE